jgi:hypothetical protein
LFFSGHSPAQDHAGPRAKSPHLSGVNRLDSCSLRLFWQADCSRKRSTNIAQKGLASWRDRSVNKFIEGAKTLRDPAPPGQELRRGRGTAADIAACLKGDPRA